jgi:exonuclease SbcC
MEEERERVREEGLESKNKLESLEAASVRLKEETSRKEESISLIVDATHCPLCGGELHEAERENVRRNYAGELSALHSELSENIQETKACKARILGLRERYVELGRKLQDKVEVEKKLAEISVAAEQARQAKSEMESVGRELSEMEGMLMEGRFSADEKASLERLFQEMEKLGYDENYHLKIRAKADELQTFQLKKAELDSALARIVSISDRLPALQERLRDIEEALKTRSYVQEEDDKLKEVEEGLRRLNYRQDVHQRVREELSSLSWVQEKKVLLDQAQRSIQVERELLRRMRSDREEVEKRHNQLKHERDALEADLRGAAGTLDRLGKLDGLLRERHEARLALREGLGVSREKLEECLRLERQYQARLKEREEANYRGAIYDELSEAFGKKGIQAIIIENVIPILEREANSILGRMTDNRMHITFETQREKKGSAGVVETLDIRISDELGTRNYELYSGGEAFRVNFAIRIALSKLLAERAGARLRALIIDEGFGTQDGEGRERLVEALRAIEKDFDKIIVVTHIPELKDAFPARIEVQKSSDGGSRFEVFYNN